MIREREGKKCRLSQDEECHIKPKLKHSGGLNGLTGSKDPVISRNQDTACPGKFKWGANIMEMCAHPSYFFASYFIGASGTLLGLQTRQDLL